MTALNRFIKLLFNKPAWLICLASLCGLTLFSACASGPAPEEQSTDWELLQQLPARMPMDLSEGSPDLEWWREAQKTREQRIQWWQDARFGCFIHWNASSLLAGEWKGEVYMGYAEHIQRMAKIPCPVYREEVVGSFNPTKFDADEWVRLIKRAGMRYLVITAKHHDGFAMWDSDVNDYNIVDATPFGRDPMRELKDACEKYGIHFGVYYSHAFDWGEENGPGNDWDYENPGGNRGLFGGLKWYDEHPELLPRIRTYINNKSIPQVLELIKKYDPDLIWFDTASKLPPEETLRILKKVREAKPDIVVNSRIVYPAVLPGRSGHFGDYLSTGDRAVEFLPREGDWEAIPTTNESYGYHKHDHSHKTPDYLIKVLAKAAAKGGNILLNIGPRGDGTIDPVDVKILEGIGEWMKVNESSVCEAGRTTLTVQPWGQSTLDGNRFYLHVFDWPEDGKIEVGGLKSDVLKAWMLADTTQTPLKHQRIDDVTVEMQLAGSAPAVGHAVVVMEVQDAAATDDHRLVSVQSDTLLHGFDSQITGSGYKFGDGKARRDYIEGWNGENQKLIWKIYLREPASFEISAEYQRLGEPGDFKVTCGEQVFQATTKGDVVENWFSDYIEHDLGRLELPAGQHTIELSPVGTPEEGLMRFRALHLNPQ